MNPSKPESATTDERLPATEYIGYALGDTASNFFYQTFNMFLNYYYLKVWGIPATAMLWLMPVVGLIGAFADPTMGLIADRTKTRWGKFRPYLFWGAIPYGICGYLMFTGWDLSVNVKVLYAFITYTLMLICYSVINVPYSSLLGVISSSSRTRAVASSVRFMGAFTGTLLVSLFVLPLVKYFGTNEAGPPNSLLGFRWTMAIFAVVSVVMFWFTFATTKERVMPPPKQKTDVGQELRELGRNWPWVMLLIASVLSTTFTALRAGSTLFFFQCVVHDDGKPFFSISFLDFDRATIFLTLGSIGLVSGTALLGSIVRKVDKKYCAAALSAITGLCFASFCIVPKDNYALMIGLHVLAQFCAGPTSALTWALYGDVADYGEWKYGRRSTGLVYSASLFAIKTGGLAGIFLVPLFLQCFGFDRDADVQTRTALIGITLAFSVVPGLIALLKAVALLIYPLNQKRVDQIEHELAARRAAS
jgi:glycoside/pentoside/hexuronide:cation symporter, GPH family